MLKLVDYPLYRAVCHLHKVLEDRVRSFPKDYAFLRNRIRTIMTKLVFLVHHAIVAKTIKKRRKKLKKAINKILKLNFYLRMSNESRLLSLKQASYYLFLLKDIHQQVYLWNRSLKRSAININ